MDKDSKSGGAAFPGNGIVAVVLLVMGALFVRESPLVNTRPAADEQRIEQRHSRQEIEQDVEARLWQDPLGAVARYRASFAKAGEGKLQKEDERHSLAAMLREMDKKVAESKTLPPQVIVVLMAGGHYSDNVENRRRERYAVLAALDAGRLTPADTEKIGYFIPDLEDSKKKAADGELVPVPYEWMDPSVDLPANEPDPAKKDWSTVPLQTPVLVMWMQADLLGSKPMGYLLGLASRFPPGVGWRVLGPTASDGLKTMVDEADKPDPRSKAEAEAFDRMRFYSLYATVPKAVLQRGGTEGKDAKCRSRLDLCLSEDLHLIRTVDDDSHLAEALIAELKLRSLNTTEDVKGADCKDRETHTPPSQIAIVAEWDTLYGRSLRTNFQPRKAGDGRMLPGFCVDSYNYVRGLDGQAAEAGGGGKDTGAAKAGANGKDEGRRSDGTFVEVAEGQSQFDYLRRLAVQMRSKDEMLRRTRGDHKGFRAVGILGTDVHDKLLVMQALRSELPDAIFFTTDMDARFLHPREQVWARNLVVASTFGLQLSRSIQQGVPPFRDSYQTSAYLATRLAMNDALTGNQDSVASLQKRLDQSFKPWRIFEIGRTMIFDYKGLPRGAAKRGCTDKLWGFCDFHPPGSEAYPKPGALAIAAICSLLILLAWLPWVLVFRGARERFAQLLQQATHSGRARGWLAGLIVGVLVLQLLLPAGLAYQWDSFAHHLTQDGEPMVATEGISVWPSEGLRLLTTVLCCYLIIRSWLMLSYNLNDINEAFKSKAARTDLEAQRLDLDRTIGPARRAIQMFLKNCVEPLSRRSSKLRAHGMCDDALDHWGRHIVQNRFWARIWRAVAWAGSALVLTALLFLVTADAQFIPARGVEVIEWHRALRIAAMLAMYLLMAFVVDATLLCVHFVGGLMRLRDQARTWPRAALKHFGDELGIADDRIVGSWVDLRFMAMRTSCVTRLIYYPFVVLSLWLLSRNPAFDRWTVSFSAMAPAVLGALVMLGCGYLLHRAAQDSRADALERLGNEISTVSGSAAQRPAAAPNAEQLKQLRTRIENLEEGAFAPFWQQPLLKAMALPFATLGGTSLLDYLTQAKL